MVTADQAPTLLVVGAGEVADALETIGRTLGWRPVVTDELEPALEALPDAEYVAVLSHHSGVDAPVLAAALDSDASYVGAMGSRKTQSRRREEMLEAGVADERLEAIRGPAGLDIGANTPAEIAVSIVAEIVAESRGQGGGSISDRDGPIHPNLPAGTADCPGE